MTPALQLLTDLLIDLATALHWPWAVFNLMALQRRLGLRYHR